MKRRLTLFAFVVSLVTCGPGTDVRGFPNAFAAVLCHFAYHCCTPADRSNPYFDFAAIATNEGYDDEGSCTAKLGDVFQTSVQPLQDSVLEKRLAFNQAAAQACVDSLSRAANPCSFEAYSAATNSADGGCGTQSSGFNGLFTGLVPAGGACTEDLDCSIPNSVCNIPYQTDGGVALVASVGTCVAPPTTGQPCNGLQACAKGNCCAFSGVCVAYVAQGGACDNNFGGGCTLKPCDPATTFCSGLTNPICAQLVANGGTCLGDGNCQSGYCNAGKCADQPAGPATQVSICSGNPDGL